MPSKKSNKKPKKKSKRAQTSTPLSGHTRKGKNLLPPLAFMPNIVPTSWINDRLPEMIWANLILISTNRENALDYFRRCLEFIGRHPKKDKLNDITLTGISDLELELQKEFIAFLVEIPAAGEALATLRMFQSLPAKQVWDELLPATAPNIELLMDAVGSTLWHQSQEATDLRWLKVTAQVVSGIYHVPFDMEKQLIGYPNEGDQRDVRPRIRASEGSTNPLNPPDLTWPNAFWEEAWMSTPCIELIKEKVDDSIIQEFVTRDQISEIVSNLNDHWESTHSTTTTDAKHDGVFGMAYYSLRILEEMMGIGLGSSVLSRLGLRTLLEVRLNLSYLLAKDSDEEWKKWRSYGSGQAKLNALKFDENVDPPKHINLKSIEMIANEDIWDEFLTINLASWSGLDLRKLSEATGLKDDYDKHYSWTSGYSHGMWGPIRESCYQTCGNPLHRLHRYPNSMLLSDTVSDSLLMVDEVLKKVDEAYPPFPHRLSSVDETIKS